MKTVTLTKPWGGKVAGTALEVDDLRAAALDKDGYLDQLAAPTPVVLAEPVKAKEAVEPAGGK